MLLTYIAVKALIKNKETFLILKNKDSDQNDELSGWETPGGRLENGEEILTGLKREIKEETGLETNILFPFNAYSGSTEPEDAIIGINYIAEYTGGDVIIDPNEHSKYKWATIPEIRKLTKSIGLQKEINACEGFLNKIK